MLVFNFHILYLIASRAGSLAPDRYVSMAPPPPEIKRFFLSFLGRGMAARVSPPPISILAPFWAKIALYRAFVPLSKGLSSNFPMGPFQTIVPAPWMMSV